MTEAYSPHRVARERDGFTLVEAMVALVVLMFGVVMMAGLTGAIMQANRDSVNRSRADAALYSRIEQFQSTPYQDIANGSDSMTIGGVTFSRSWIVSPNTPIPNVMEIQLTVRWADRGDTLEVRKTTLRGQS
ncbi:MAG: prepilin-type N-terminal cleavage/methylation domain-containing protein [Gemmatimonadota bacterium]|nr:prepilin-type N-terminal cleavage/methylation domain-containing protein [Gemmatimonadota bacterium]